MPNNLRIGGTITVLDAGIGVTAADRADVASVVGIDVGSVQYDIEDIITPQGATGAIRRRLQPIVITFRARSIEMNLVALKWRPGVDIIYQSNLENQSDFGGALDNTTREILNARGIIRDVVTPDTDFGEIPVTTVTFNALQYMRAEVGITISGGVYTPNAVAEIGEWANVERGVHITGGYINRALIDAATFTPDSFSNFAATGGHFVGTTTDDAPPLTSGITGSGFSLAGAHIAARNTAVPAVGG